MRAACSFLAEPDLQGDQLLAGLAGAVSVFYNASGTFNCLDYDAAPNPASAEVGELWGWVPTCAAAWVLLHAACRA